MTDTLSEPLPEAEAPVPTGSQPAPTLPQPAPAQQPPEAAAERLQALAAGASRARALRVAVLVAADFLALVAAGTVGYLLWARPVRGQEAELYLGLVPLLVLFIAGYALSGLYPGFGLGPVETLRRLTRVTAFGFLTLGAVTYAVKLPHLFSRVTIVITFVLALLGVPATRWLVARLFGRSRAWSEPVVVIGEASRAATSIAALRRLERREYRPLGALDPVEPVAEERAEVEGVPVLGGLELAELLAGAGVRVAIVDLEGLDERATVDRLQRHFRHVITLRRVSELPVEGVQIRNLGGVLGMEHTNNLLRPANRAVKRASDLAIGGLAVLLAAPVIALGALAVKLASRGPAFFVQEREGLHGEQIRVRKIRTMHVDAERRLHEHLERHPDLKREWEERYKLQHDPRLIPGIGGFLRRFSLDELPQLLSVVEGSMSLVGPRPFPDYHLGRFSPEFRALRSRVRPGITGLWQVTVRSEGGIEEQEAYDTHYIRNWSLWLDLHILARTLGAVIAGRGAY